MNAVATRNDERARERRVHERHGVRIPATLGLLGYEVQGTLEDIGVGGARFVTSDHTLMVEPANIVNVRFRRLIEGAPQRISRFVRAVYITEREPESPGTKHPDRVIGLSFDEPLPLEGLDLLD